MSNYIKLISDQGLLFDGSRLVSNVRFNLELYDDYFYHNLEEQFDNDLDPDLLLVEFAVSFRLIKEMHVECAHDKYGEPFYYVAIEAYNDFTKSSTRTRVIRVLGGEGQTEEVAKSMLTEIDALREQDETGNKGSFELLEAKRAFFAERYHEHPDVYTKKLVDYGVDVIYKKEHIVLGVHPYDAFCFFDNLLYSHLTLPGYPLEARELDDVDNNIQPMRKIAYALGFANLKAYRDFRKKEEGLSFEGFERILDHDLFGLDPLSPVILVFFLHGLRDNALIVNYRCNHAAYQSMCKMLSKHFTYEQYIHDFQIPKHEVIAMRLNQREFGKF